MKKIILLFCFFWLVNNSFAQAPANDLCANAISVSIPSTTSASTTLATSDTAPNCGSAFDDSSGGIWYTVVGDGNQIVASLCDANTDFDTQIRVFTGACGALTCVVGNDQFCNDASQVTWTSVLGTTYRILVYGWGGSTGNFKLNISNPPPPPTNDLCTNPIALSLPADVSGSTTFATNETAPSCGSASDGSGGGVWYTVVGNGSTIKAAVCYFTTFDTQIRVFTGSCGALTCVEGNDDSCDLKSEVSWSSSIGVTYRILVHGFGTNSGDFVLTVATPPVNEICTNSIAIAVPSTTVASTLAASVDVAPSCNTVNNSSGGGVWYNLVGNGENLTASLCAGTDYDSRIRVFTGTCGALTCVTGNDDECGFASEASWNSSVGVNYTILVHGANEGNFTLDIKSGQTITFNSLAAKTFGDAPFSLTATSNSGLPVSYASSNTSVATISGSTLTIVGAGTSTITASQAGNSGFFPAANVPRLLTVNKANQTITFGTLSAKVFTDIPFNLTATSSSGLPVSYSSSNTAVATVLGSTVTIAGVGTTNITASQAGNANYNAATNVIQPQLVNKANQTITFNSLNAKTFGDIPFNLAATASSGLPVSYSSSNTSVATVSGNTVTIVGAGTTNITASQAGNANYNAATNVIQSLSVNKANQTITFNSLAAKTFGDIPFNLTASSSSGLSISYSSSNTSVATVTGNTVTIVGAGTTTITASQAGNTNYNAATDVLQSLTVNKLNQTITFGALSSKTVGDANFTLGATASSGLTVSYASSNTSVATVTGNTVTIVGGGTTTITASQDGNTSYNAAADVPQLLTVNKLNQTITFGTLTQKSFGDADFTLSGTSSSDLSVSYVSSDITVASVSGNTVTIVGAGTTTITASQSGNTNYNPATDVLQSLTVNKSAQTITFGMLASKVVGEPAFELTGSASSGLPLSYVSGNTAVASISGSTVTILSVGTSIITASQAGNANYLAATNVDQTLNVLTKEDQTITFNSIPPKTFGDAPFGLTATASSGLTVTFSTTSTKITISGSQVSLVSAGRATVTASQEGDDNYNAADNVDQSFCINPAKPNITKGPDGESVTLTSSASAGNQWFKDETAIAGATNSTLTVTTPGTYKVQVTADDCVSEFSGNVALIVTGDIDMSQQSTSLLYPNPAFEQVTISLNDFESDKTVAIRIMDMQGRVMTKLEAKGKQNAVIDVRSYSKGSYLVIMNQATRIRRMQFIKTDKNN